MLADERDAGHVPPSQPNHAARTSSIGEVRRESRARAFTSAGAATKAGLKIPSASGRVSCGGSWAVSPEAGSPRGRLSSVDRRGRQQIGDAPHDLDEAVGELEQGVVELAPALRDRQPPRVLHHRLSVSVDLPGGGEGAA